MIAVRWFSWESILHITAHTYNRSAYDAAYLALAKNEQISLVTADKHLYNAVKDKCRLVLWVEDFE